jgi:hypothetical protein
VLAGPAAGGGGADPQLMAANASIITRIDTIPFFIQKLLFIKHSYCITLSKNMWITKHKAHSTNAYT